MGIADRLKDLSDRAKDTAVEHRYEIQQAVDRAGALVDERTAGKYHDKIAAAGDRATAYVDGLAPEPKSPPEAPKAPAA